MPWYSVQASAADLVYETYRTTRPLRWNVDPTRFAPTDDLSPSGPESPLETPTTSAPAAPSATDLV